jgi:pilus assembly protein CpaF
MTTIHANDTRDALGRLEMMVMMAGFDLPVPVIRQYIASSIGLIIQVSRLKGGPRKVTKVTEIVELRRRSYVLRDIFGFRQKGVDEAGMATGEFYATGYEPTFLGRLKSMGVELPQDLFRERILPPYNGRA